MIWNNKNIKVDCKTIFYPLYVEAGFLICKHMLLNMTNLESYNFAKRKGLKHSNLFQTYSTRTKTLRGKRERTVVIRISVWGKSI